MASFDEEQCIIPELWCGEANKPPKKKGVIYYKTGSRYECMKRGFGAGMYSTKKETLPAKSLQQIKYIGEVHEESFIRYGIKDIPTLIKEMKGRTTNGIETILKKILVKSNGVFDAKAYNSTLVFLHKNGTANLPACKKIRL